MSDVQIGKIYVNKHGQEAYVFDYDEEGDVWFVRPGADDTGCRGCASFLKEYTLKLDAVTDYMIHRACVIYGAQNAGSITWDKDDERRMKLALEYALDLNETIQVNPTQEGG